MNNNKSFKIWIIIFISTTFFSCNSAKNENNENQNSNWIVSLIEAYKALNENRNIESAQLLFEASEKMPKKNWENYFMMATIFASNDELNSAFKSLDIAIESGLRDIELLSTYPDLSTLRDDSRWNKILEKTKAKKLEYIKNIENPEVLNVLEKMWAADQQALAQYEQNINKLDSKATQKDYDSLFRPIEAQWDENRERLDSIIEIHGWPGNKLVGEDGAKLAWAIPQHHHDVFYKKKCLALIKKSVDKDDLDPNHFAELNDRIARETWQKQNYGASMGKTAPYPIEDPVNVNKRRIELGLLEPIEVYAYYHGIEYNIPNPEEVNAIYEKAQSDYQKFEVFAASKGADSANTYITRAIKAYGDISNEKLYKAAIQLSQLNNRRSTQISLQILKVLVWREWDKRFQIKSEKQLKALEDEEEWNAILMLLDT